MSDEEFAALVKKSGNPEGLIAKRKQQQQQIAARENSRANYTAADAKADQERAKVEAENRRRAERGEDPLPTSQLKDPRSAVSQPTAKPSTDQEKVRAEYDRLRNSKDPKERAQKLLHMAGKWQQQVLLKRTSLDISLLLMLRRIFLHQHRECLFLIKNTGNS